MSSSVASRTRASEWLCIVVLPHVRLIVLLQGTQRGPQRCLRPLNLAMITARCQPSQHYFALSPTASAHPPRVLLLVVGRSLA